MDRNEGTSATPTAAAAPLYSGTLQLRFNVSVSGGGGGYSIRSESLISLSRVHIHSRHT